MKEVMAWEVDGRLFTDKGEATREEALMGLGRIVCDALKDSEFGQDNATQVIRALIDHSDAVVKLLQPTIPYQPPSIGDENVEQPRKNNPHPRPDRQLG
jgi:hypothetical protein